MDDPARRHQQLQAELGQIGLVLPGSLTQRTTRCQRAGCHCHADPPQLHGPYPTWTRKIGSRTITKTLTPQDAERLRPYFDAHRRLRQLITELEAISIELAGQPARRPRWEISPLSADQHTGNRQNHRSATSVGDPPPGSSGLTRRFFAGRPLLRAFRVPCEVPA